MEELIRCPNCGASNPRDAAWCGQCQTPFAPPPPASEIAATGSLTQESPPSARPSVVDAPQPPATPPAHSSPTGAAPRQHGPFVVADGGVTWACASCGSNNPIELTVCSVCGASFRATVEPEAEPPARDPNTTALVSLVYPGAGFAYLKRWPEAIGRGVVGTFAIVIALIAAIVGHGSTAGIIAITYGLAAFALWVLGAHDAYRVAQRREAMVILKPRTLLYVLMGLLVLFLVLLIGSVVGRSSR